MYRTPRRGGERSSCAESGVGTVCHKHLVQHRLGTLTRPAFGSKPERGGRMTGHERGVVDEHRLA